MVFCTNLPLIFIPGLCMTVSEMQAHTARWHTLACSDHLEGDGALRPVRDLLRHPLQQRRHAHVVRVERGDGPHLQTPAPTRHTLCGAILTSDMRCMSFPLPCAQPHCPPGSMQHLPLGSWLASACRSSTGMFRGLVMVHQAQRAQQQHERARRASDRARGNCAVEH